MDNAIVAVAMSGGVDSSVTAALLVEQGYSVIGVTMQLFQHPQNITDAKIAADKLGIPHYVYDFRQEFQERIIRYFCDEYTAGKTPNPCVLCNPQIKFGLLFEKARESGAQLMATGHYVNVEYDKTTRRYLLRSATTEAKDQSYFLYRLTQEQLARTLFPLAGMMKEQIREKAKELGLDHVAAKEESQENCFVADQSYQQFLEDYLPPEAKTPGPIVDTEGNVLGQHQGIYLYTIGQRRGLGIALGTPRYVVAIDPQKNTIIIGENAELFTREFFVRDLNFIAIDRLTSAMDVEVKIRYRNPATPARILPGKHDDEVKVILETPQRAVTPGQSAVFYQGDIVVGGGVIQKEEE
jgi:tRNA-specific 2-thiouridylase